MNLVPSSKKNQKLQDLSDLKDVEKARYFLFKIFDFSKQRIITTNEELPSKQITNAGGLWETQKM